jgi:hypothetical protein
VPPVEPPQLIDDLEAFSFRGGPCELPFQLGTPIL